MTQGGLEHFRDEREETTSTHEPQRPEPPSPSLGSPSERIFLMSQTARAALNGVVITERSDQHRNPEGGTDSGQNTPPLLASRRRKDTARPPTPEEQSQLAQVQARRSSTIDYAGVAAAMEGTRPIPNGTKSE